ncbi:MAG: pilus assembly protein PilM [Deltaproteobacteria bacterium]|nr:pilus assembly protein PilM [Deltaproteobacteria bacterium]
MAFQSSLGIDIGDSALRVVYLKAALREIRVSAHAVYPVDRELPVEEGLKAAGENLKAFIDKNRVTAGNVFVGIPRRLAIVRDMELPFAAKENLREAVGYEMEKYVPFSADDVYFDFQIIEENKADNRLIILLTLVKKEAMSPYAELGGLLGTGISGIEISSTAVTNYVIRRENVRVGDACVILWRADDALELNLIRRNRLAYSRVLAVADDSDRLRETVRGEFKSIQTVLGHPEDPVRAIACGSDTEDGWLRVIEEEGTRNIARVDLSKTGLASQSLIPAYGLALKGLEKTAVDINLLPPEHRRKAGRVGFYVMVGLVLLLFVSAAGWGAGSVARQRFYMKRLNHQIKALEPEVADVRRAQDKDKDLDKRIDYINGIRGTRSPLLDILKDLSKTIPKSAWISSFTFSEKGVELEGYADSASELIPLLEASPHFKDAVFRSAITKSREGKERFKIGLQVN